MRKFFNFSLLWRVIKLASPYKGLFFLAIFSAIIRSLLVPLNPYLIQLTIDRNIARNDLSGLNHMILLLVALILLQAFVQYIFIYLTNWLGQNIIRNLRVSVFNHITSLRMRFFDQTPIGTVTTRTINDVETINDIFAQGIITIAADLMSIVTIIALMLYMDWRLSLVCFITLPLLIIATYIFKEKVKVAFEHIRNQVARMNAFLQEHISGMKVVQIFTAEGREMHQFETINRKYKQANVKAILYYSVFFPVIEIITAIALGLLVWYGAFQVISGVSSLGILIAFFLYLNLLFRPIRMLADKFNTVQMGLVAAERVFKLLDRQEQIKNQGQWMPASIHGHIQIEHLWFAYSDEQYVLKDINFEVLPGQTLAIVGATGSGKTSIINVLNRYYAFQKGEILIDGKNVTEYSLDNLRKHIGNVMQDVFLFTGSIYDNITLRNPSISLETVKEASRICGVHDFIEALPGQYDFDVHERGSTLSLGQRQLIAFVRTFIYNPAILILDEATSSIDRETERYLQKAIDILTKNRTAIIIAHRLSTIQHADTILVMQKGKVVEKGKHSTLIRQDGLYRKLYEMQFTDQQA